MDITIKHASRKAEITQQSNGVPVCKLFCINGIFLRTRTFTAMDQAIDFSIQWLYDMENNRVSEFDSIIKQAEKGMI